MNKIIRKIILGFFIVVISIGVAFFLNNKEEDKIDQYTVKRQNVTETVIIDGMLDFSNKKIFRLSNKAVLKVINVSDGAQVVNGDLLIKFVSSELKTKLDKAKATFELEEVKLNLLLNGDDSTKKMELERAWVLTKNKWEKFQKEEDYQKILFKNGHISRDEWNDWIVEKQNAELDFKVAEEKYLQSQEGPSPVELSLAKAEKEVAKQEYENIKKQYDALEIVAPFNGKIFNLQIYQQDLNKEFDEGIQVCVLAEENDEVIVHSQVYENQLNKLSLGMIGKVQIPGQEKPLEAVLDRIGYSPIAPSGLKKYPIVLKIDDVLEKSFKFGSRVDITLAVSEAKDVLVVPLKFICWQGRKEGVWKKEKGLKIIQHVKTGIRDYEFVEIISGLEQGEKIYLK